MKKYSVVRVDIFDGRETEEVVLENMEKAEAEREAYILGDSAQTGTYYEVREYETRVDLTYEVNHAISVEEAAKIADVPKGTEYMKFDNYIEFYTEDGIVSVEVK